MFPFFLFISMTEFINTEKEPFSRRSVTIDFFVWQITP